MNRGKLDAFMLIATALHASGVVAGELGSPDFSFSSFGTAGVVHSSDNQSDFVSNGRQPAGAGFTHSWSVTTDSKVGAQVTADFTDQLSAIVQLVSQYQADGTYRPDVEWANVRYQATPDIGIRVGRIAIPTFMHSDSLNVGYALPYVRIPIEIYAQLPVTNSDGIDASYRFHIGDPTFTVQAFAGRFNSATPNDGHYNVRDLHGIAATLEDEPLTVHVSYQALRYDLSLFGFQVSKDPQSIATVGVSYDPGRWFVSGELIRAPDDVFGLYYGGYVIGGYRIAKFTSYIGYARSHMTHPGSSGATSFLEQYTNILGLRWDFTRHMDLKLQLDRTVRQGGTTFSINQQPGFDTTGTVNVFSLAVDVVW